MVFLSMFSAAEAQGWCSLAVVNGDAVLASRLFLRVLSISVPAGGELGRPEAFYPKLHLERVAEPAGGNPDSSALWDDKKLIHNPQAGSEILILYLAAVCLLLSQKLENASIHQLDFHLHTSSHLNFKYNILCRFKCLPHMATLWTVKIKIKPSFQKNAQWRIMLSWALSQFLLDDILPSITNRSMVLSTHPEITMFHRQMKLSWFCEFVKHFGTF